MNRDTAVTFRVTLPRDVTPLQEYQRLNGKGIALASKDEIEARDPLGPHSGINGARTTERES